MIFYDQDGIPIVATSGNIDGTYKEWYRLDNAAVIFSLITSEDLPAVFRLAITLEKTIQYDLMQQALEEIIERFPYFRVQLRKGWFWYHLAHNSKTPKILAEVNEPCRYIPVYDTRELPFRVRIYGKRIAVEFHHGITDGTGAKSFLFALVTHYLELSGIKFTNIGNIKHLGQIISIEEYEDAFKRYYEAKIPHLPRYSQAFQLPFQTDPRGKFHVTRAKVAIDAVKPITKQFGVTITELLTAVYIDSLQHVYLGLSEVLREKLARPIRVSVAINLRNFFPSKTMRNFSLHVVAGIDPRLGTYEFDEVVSIVHHSLQVDINEKDILRQIKRNVRGEMHPLMRMTPVILKNIFGRYIYSIFGERQFSGSVSNLGYISPPGDLKEHITDFEFVPARNQIRTVNCSISGFADDLTINFGNTSNNHAVERLFFRRLAQLGITARIDTNYD